MTKHNQTKSLGPLTNFQSAPEPKPETTDERIDRLERRLLQVETLLNDVMHQLDTPGTQPKSKINGRSPSQAKPKTVKLKQVTPKQANPKMVKPATPEARATHDANNEAQKQEAEAEAQKCMPALIERLSDGSSLTDIEIKESLGIGKKKWQRMKALADFTAILTTTRNEEKKQVYHLTPQETPK